MTLRAAHTVERSRERAIREHETRTLRPHRQFNRPPAPIGLAVAAPADMRLLAEKIEDRIRDNRYRHSSGSFLLVMKDGKAYVLRENETKTPALLDGRELFLVGLYAASGKNKRRAQCPKAAQILGDIEQHLKDLGVLLG